MRRDFCRRPENQSDAAGCRKRGDFYLNYAILKQAEKDYQGFISMNADGDQSLHPCIVARNPGN